MILSEGKKYLINKNSENDQRLLPDFQTLSKRVSCHTPFFFVFNRNYIFSDLEDIDSISRADLSSGEQKSDYKNF